MSRIMDTKSQELPVTCPNCEHEFTKEVIVSIYEPNIDIDITI